MLTVVKKPYTKTSLFEVKGKIPVVVMDYLRQTFGQDVEILEDKDDDVNPALSTWIEPGSHELWFHHRLKEAG